MTTSIKALLDQADRLIKAVKLEEALVACRAALELDPADLRALHWQSWILDELLRGDPQRPDGDAMRAQQRALRDEILRRTTLLDDTDDVPRRARALALHQRASERLMSDDLVEAELALAEMREAVQLRDVDFLRAGLLQARARWALLAARSDPAAGYSELLTLVSESLEGSGPGAVLDDPGYLAWLDGRLAAEPERGVRERLDDALLRAAGKDTLAAINRLAQDEGHPGRGGRLMTLIKLGADVCARHEYDQSTALHYAAAVGDAAAIEALTRLGAQVDARDEDGQTALHKAAEQQRVDALRALARCDADLEARDGHGRTAMHEAAFSADEATIEALVGAGAKVASVDEAGTTPLHLAARSCNRKTIPALLGHGADPRAEDERGRTALDEALERGHGDLAPLLGAALAPTGVLPLQQLIDGLAAASEELLADPLFEEDSTDALAGLLAAGAHKALRTWHELAPLLHPGRGPRNAYGAVWLARRFLPRAPAETLDRAGGFFLGDLRVRGDLRLSGPLLVCGDLVVDGVIADAGPDSLLVVGGGVRARALITDGDVSVGGDLVVDEVIYGAYNDNSLLVGGELRARALIEDDHDVRCHRGLRVAHHFPLGDYTSTDPLLAELFVDEVFEDGALDRHKLTSRLIAGRSVLREDVAPEVRPGSKPRKSRKPRSESPKPAPTSKPRPTARQESAKKPKPRPTARETAKKPKPRSRARRTTTKRR